MTTDSRATRFQQLKIREFKLAHNLSFPADMSEDVVDYFCLLANMLVGHPKNFRVENNQVKFKFFTTNHILSLTFSPWTDAPPCKEFKFQEEFEYYVNLIDVGCFNDMLVHWNNEILYVQDQKSSYVLFVEKVLDIKSWHKKQNKKISKRRRQTRLRRRAIRRMKKAAKARMSRR